MKIIANRAKLLNPEEKEKNGRRNVLIKHGLLRNYFLTIPKVVMADKQLSLQAKLAFAVLLDFIHKDGRGEIFPSQETLCKRLQVSSKTLRKYLNELKEKGYLRWKKRGMPARNFYILDIPEVTPERFDVETWGIDPSRVNSLTAIVNLAFPPVGNMGSQLVGNMGSQLVGNPGLQEQYQHNKPATDNKNVRNSYATSASNVTIGRPSPKTREEFVSILRERGFSEDEIGLREIGFSEDGKRTDLPLDDE